MNNNDMGILRRWVVLVMLSLLAFVVIGNFFDDLFFGNKFVIDPAFYALIGGLITGLFSAEAIAIWRRK